VAEKSSKGYVGEPVTVEIDLQPLEKADVKMTKAQVQRLLACVGNTVASWLRYDLKDRRPIPVVTHEGTQSWSSEDGEFRDV
jgi:hypothetical protein